MSEFQDSNRTEETASDTTPLLSSRRTSEDNSPAPSTPGRATASRKWLLLASISVYILAIDLGYYLTAAPQMEIFQNIICRRTYSHIYPGGADDNDGLCKSEAVQRELAVVNGWMDTFTVLPGVLLSVPFGILADRWGRKPVLNLSLVGYLLGEAWARVVCLWPNIFPLRLVWLSGLWKVVGGGESVISSTALVMVADVCSGEERGNVLFYINGVVIIAEVLAIPLSACLMKLGPWLPYTLGFLVEILGGFLVLLLPETLGAAKEKSNLVFSRVVMREWDEDVDLTSRESVTDILVRRICEFRDSMRAIWENNRNVILILVTFFVATVSKQSTGLFLQYASKKFHWSIAHANLLVAVRGIVTLVNFLILMPLLSYLITKYLHWEPTWKDFRLSQGCGLLATIGFAIIALAAVPAVLVLGLVAISLGSALAVTSRSLATSLVAADHVGTLYSAAAVMQSLGNLVAGPLFACGFNLGMRLGEEWLGLPFLLAALLFVIVFAAISCIRLDAIGSRSSDDWDLYEDRESRSSRS